MGYFQVRNDSRVVIYKRKMFIRLATDLCCGTLVEPEITHHKGQNYCTASLQCGWIGFDQTRKYVAICIY